MSYIKLKCKIGLALSCKCAVHGGGRNWIKGCVVGHVVYRPDRRVDWCEWPATQRSIYCACNVCEWIKTPNSSLSCLLCMVLIILMFLLLGVFIHSHTLQAQYIDLWAAGHSHQSTLRSGLYTTWPTTHPVIQFHPPPCTARLHNRVSPILYFNFIYDVLTS